MDILLWIATGVLVGWVVRQAMGTRREFGIFGDLLTGSLGAMVGGWILELAGVTAQAQGLVAHIVVAVMGAMVLLGTVRVMQRLLVAGQHAGSHLRPAAIDLETQIARLGEWERRVLSSVLRRGSTTVDPNRSFDAQLSFGERLADRVATFGGSWTFIGLFLVFMLAWMALNRRLANPVDPFPFILLNLMLSCLAALQAPIIMMSQNRQASKDRSDARLDYDVNVRAEIQIAALHEKIDRTREQELARLCAAVDEQRALIIALERRLADRDMR